MSKMIQDLTSSKTQRWLRVLVDTKQTQPLIQLGNNFLACTQDVTIVWYRIFLDVSKRYDRRRKFNLGSSCCKPLGFKARRSMTVVNGIATRMNHRSYSVISDLCKTVHNSRIVGMNCKHRTQRAFFLILLFPRTSRRKYIRLDDPGFDIYLYSKMSRPALELTQPYIQ